MSADRYQSFWEFFPFYLSEHGDRTNRILHFIGTSLVITIAVVAAVTLNPWLGDFVMFGLALSGQLHKYMPDGPVAPPMPKSNT